jgi:hypothetical protein
MGQISDFSLAHLHGVGLPPPISPAPREEAAYVAYLADDRQFIAELAHALAPQGTFGNGTAAYLATMAAAEQNIGNLTPEERAQVIRAAGTYRDPKQSRDANPALQTIERLANNQGYTGPDAGTVVATTPTAAGGTHAVTRGEILDNENFGNLVNTVFTAAGGKPLFSAPLLPNFLGGSGMPGSIFTSTDRNALNGIDLTKMSEAERIAFLNKVAEFGRDGTLSREEEHQLKNMALGYCRDGDSEPTAVTANTGFGNPTAVSKDDLMENGTFERLLNSMTSQGLFASMDMEDNNPETKALRDAIATANYDELGYEERVALVQAFNAANGDHTISAQEADGIVKMLQAFQKPSGAGGAASTGTTLSNGLVVSPKDVEKPGNFSSMVNSVLDRSGVEMPKPEPFGGGYSSSSSDNRYTVPMLRRLDVSALTPGQRTEILEMIAQAGSDREITGKEAKSIVDRVNAWSPNRPQQGAMMGGYHFV